jgi:hypothetical protein
MPRWPKPVIVAGERLVADLDHVADRVAVVGPGEAVEPR